MPKNFRTLPEFAIRSVEQIAGDAVEVRSVQLMSAQEITQLNQLHLTLDEVVIGASWRISPAELSGRTSKKNLEGWVVVREDLPKYTKTFCNEIQNFGDASTYGWSTVCRDREVYHRDTFPAHLHEVIVTVEEELPDGRFGVRFTLSDNFDKRSPEFETDLLFGINVIQENFGGATLSAPDAPRQFFTEMLDWELFPPGDVEAVIGSLTEAGRLTVPNEIETARARLQLFERFEPMNYIRGLSGNDTYVGAKFADDLVVFESTKYGNALYMLYVDWEELSTRPRSELLKLSGNQVDRVVHRGSWESEFTELMRAKLKARGVRLRLRR